jgi:hypothetical protein
MEDYQVALQNADGSLTYASGVIAATGESEAIENAKHWAATVGPLPEDAWLIVNLKGRARSLRPGEF